MMENHGVQCGFCTPGMVMTMYTVFRNNPEPTQEDMERALEGWLIYTAENLPRLNHIIKALFCHYMIVMILYKLMVYM